MRKKLLCSTLVFLAICSILILTLIWNQSDSGNNYSKFELQFMNEYYKMIENVYSKEVDDILLKLQSKHNTDILARMNQMLNDNKKMRKGHEEKFDRLHNLYSGLVDLKDAYSNWDSLDLDRKLYLNSQINYIYVYISQLEYGRQKNDKTEK